MKIRFEASGTHTHKEELKVRLDFVPDVADKSYKLHYVEYPKDSGIHVLNPCYCAFVKVDENITKSLLQEFCGDIFTTDVLATIDDIMVQPKSAHLIGPYMRKRNILSSAKTHSFDEQLKDEVDSKLADFVFQRGEGGDIQPVRSGSIDVGLPAIYRGSYQTSNLTTVNLDNPALADGTIDTVQFYFQTNGANVEAATFFLVGGSNYSTRDNEAIGAVASGSTQSFGVDIDIYAADLIGAYWTSGSLAKDTSGYAGVLYKLGDQIPCVNVSFNTYASHGASIRGTGPEASGMAGGGTSSIGTALFVGRFI